MVNTDQAARRRGRTLEVCVIVGAIAWCLAGPVGAAAEEAASPAGGDAFLKIGPALTGRSVDQRSRGDERAWYVSTSAAAFIADENNLDHDKVGMQGSFMLGRRLMDGRYRAEVEISERRVGLTGLNGASTADGELIAQVAFLNGYVHARPDADWDAYFGGGVGWGRQSYRLRGPADNMDFSVEMHDEAQSFASHAMAGITRVLSPSTSFHVEGRFLILRDKALEANVGTWNGIERAYQLGAGLTYAF